MILWNWNRELSVNPAKLTNIMLTTQSHSSRETNPKIKASKLKTEVSANWDMVSQRMSNNQLRGDADPQSKEQATRFRKTIILLSKTRRNNNRGKKSIARRMEMNQAEANYSFDAEEVLFQELPVSRQPLCKKIDHSKYRLIISIILFAKAGQDQFIQTLILIFPIELYCVYLLQFIYIPIHISIPIYINSYIYQFLYIYCCAKST